MVERVRLKGFIRRHNGVARKRSFTPETAPRQGRKLGSKAAITLAKVRLMQETGMMPLDFMFAVFRNELYTAYDQHTAEDGRTRYFSPRPKAKKIPVEVRDRMAAAASAAPFVHRRTPVGVEVNARNSVGITAERLRHLTNAELDDLIRLMDKMGVDLGTDGPGAVYNHQSGPLLSGPLDAA